MFDSGENVLHFNGKRGTYSGTIPRINPVVLADIGRAQARIDKLAREVPLDAPWRAPRAEAWDRETFESWGRRNLVTSSGRTLLRSQLVGWAVEPRRVHHGMP